MDLDKLYLQKKYADQLSLRLAQFSLKSNTPYHANFRCEICGDSAQNQHKKRGYLLEKDGSLLYYCHNGCGAIHFDKFLKTYHPDLYNQFLFDLMQNKKPAAVAVSIVKEKKTITGDFITPLTKLSELPPHHKAREYLLSRKLPYDSFTHIYYTEQFYHYVNSFIPDKFCSKALRYDTPRLIFPMCWEDGKMFGAVARSVNDNNVRYINIKFDETAPKIYGLDRWKRNQYTYLFEGPIDSWFLKNSLALSGTDGDLNYLKINKEKLCIVLDNQARNREVIHKYNKYISQGYQICIWPERIKSKDVNDMILSGIAANEVQSIIDENTFSGLNAQIQFMKWKKI